MDKPDKKLKRLVREAVALIDAAYELTTTERDSAGYEEIVAAAEILQMARQRVKDIGKALRPPKAPQPTAKEPAAPRKPAAKPK